jgi:hypothetical protein
MTTLGAAFFAAVVTSPPPACPSPAPASAVASAPVRKPKKKKGKPCESKEGKKAKSRHRKDKSKKAKKCGGRSPALSAALHASACKPGAGLSGVGLFGVSAPGCPPRPGHCSPTPKTSDHAMMLVFGGFMAGEGFGSNPSAGGAGAAFAVVAGAFGSDGNSLFQSPGLF